MRKKRVRKFLNIFLCVISIVVVFSVTVFAKTGYASSFVIYDNAYNVLFTEDVDLSDYVKGENFYYLHYELNSNNSEQIIIYLRHSQKDENGAQIGKGVISSYTCPKFEYIYDMTTGERYYAGDYINLSPDALPGRYVIINQSYMTDIEEIFLPVFGLVTDFATFISENALLLLFAIGLPVCSLGVGLLIRMKERT